MRFKINYDCLHFNGEIPCQYHKQFSKRCPCEYYIGRGKRILIIKLAAVGDVIRTTPLLRRLKKDYPDCEITWLTLMPEVLPSLVDIPLSLSTPSFIRLLADKFDILFNLDKDRAACALAKLVKAKIKKGFILKKGKCLPIDKDAQHKFLTGLDDKLNKSNRLSYPQEIFKMVGLEFKGEKYVLDKKPFKFAFAKLSGPIIGLNTGCGQRWRTRLWPIEKWIDLTKGLKDKGYNVVLLGGEIEHQKNLDIARQSQALYLGHFSLDNFMGLIDKCDLVVTQVTMALHIAIGLEKRVILLNNIFYEHEFELYGLGKIIQPEVDCLGCYKSECSKKCMEIINPDRVISEIEKLLPYC